MQENKEFVDDENPENPMSEQEIDENLDDSFPASDPPSWTLGSNHENGKSIQPKTEDPND